MLKKIIHDKQDTTKNLNIPKKSKTFTQSANILKNFNHITTLATPMFLFGCGGDIPNEFKKTQGERLATFNNRYPQSKILPITNGARQATKVDHIGGIATYQKQFQNMTTYELTSKPIINQNKNPIKQPTLELKDFNIVTNTRRERDLQNQNLQILDYQKQSLFESQPLESDTHNNHNIDNHHVSSILSINDDNDLHHDDEVKRQMYKMQDPLIQLIAEKNKLLVELKEEYKEHHGWLKNQNQQEQEYQKELDILCENVEDGEVSDEYVDQFIKEHQNKFNQTNEDHQQQHLRNWYEKIRQYIKLQQEINDKIKQHNEHHDLGNSQVVARLIKQPQKQLFISEQPMKFEHSLQAPSLRNETSEQLQDQRFNIRDKIAAVEANKQGFVKYFEFGKIEIEELNIVQAQTKFQNRKNIIKNKLPGQNNDKRRSSSVGNLLKGAAWKRGAQAYNPETNETRVYDNVELLNEDKEVVNNWQGFVKQDY